jgi:acyl-CoA synthetase (AMP-forming)/AMP-acid ligase II
VSHNGLEDWFPTGDAASITNGVVSILGRLAYVINSGGEKIWPEDLENLFAGIPGLEDVAVVGRPDPEWGQAVTVIAVTSKDEAQLLDACRAIAAERLGRWAQPKAIEVVSSIPRTANGKVARSAL